jgi:uncharacterized protein YyaL (SSP411 family)
MSDTCSRLWHAYRDGQAKAPATASDYANMTWGALRLFQATHRNAYLAAARGFVDVLDQHYWMQDVGGYATSANDTQDVLVRLRSAHDDATPNANAIMLSNLVQLYLLTGDEQYRARAEELPDAFAGDVGQNALGHCGLLAACMDLMAPMHVAVVGGDLPEQWSPLARAVRSLSLPGAVEQIRADPKAVPPGSPLSGKSIIGGQATAYVCVGMSCSAPMTESAVLRSTLNKLRCVSA